MRRKQLLDGIEEVTELVVREILGEPLDHDTIVSVFPGDGRCLQCISNIVVADGQIQLFDVLDVVRVSVHDVNDSVRFFLGETLSKPSCTTASFKVGVMLTGAGKRIKGVVDVWLTHVDPVIWIIPDVAFYELCDPRLKVRLLQLLLSGKCAGVWLF